MRRSSSTSGPSGAGRARRSGRCSRRPPPTKGVTLAKVDVDSNQALANEYGIRGIPAVKAFRNGHVVAEFVGAQGRAAVDAFLDELTKPPVAESVDDPGAAGGARAPATTSARSSCCSAASTRIPTARAS